VTLIVPLSGRITIEDRNGRYTARPGGALLAPMGQRKTRVEAGDDAPFVGIPILLPRSTLEAFGRHEGFQVTTVLNGSRSTLHAQAIRMATLLQEELRHGTGLLERPSAERSWTELMTEIVVDIIYQGSGLSIAADCAGSVKARRVRAAEAFMRANLSEIATLSDVARSLGISTRALELAFRSEYDISPLRFLTGLRLSEARRILVSDTDITSVTEVCLACGIGHAGRFATSYRKRYGEAPSETLLHR
jgi:AraC-like DNA-binding protein